MPNIAVFNDVYITLERMSTTQSLALWHCPFCAARLTDAPGYLYCSSGDCGFSASVIEKFLVGRAAPRPPEDFASGPSTKWYCPVCAHELNFSTVNEAPVFGCPTCGFFVPASVQHQLLHHHQHAPQPNAL
jgi:hypothetical protein